MTHGALLDHIYRIDAGGRVILRKYRMSGVTIGTTGNFFRIAEAVILAVVALYVRFYGNGGDFVPDHHFFVAVAFHTHFRVEFPPFVVIRATQLIDGVEIMAVMAGSRILVAGSNSLAVY